MAVNDAGVLMSEEELEALSKRGQAIYENKLKASLEPMHNNQYVAIHVDSEDYEIARATGAAMRALRLRHPHGALVLMKIGPEPEYGLAARLLAGEMRGAKK
jgi:hypothetical protein